MTITYGTQPNLPLIFHAHASMIRYFNCQILRDHELKGWINLSDQYVCTVQFLGEMLQLLINVLSHERARHTTVVYQAPNSGH